MRLILIATMAAMMVGQAAAKDVLSGASLYADVARTRRRRVRSVLIVAARLIVLPGLLLWVVVALLAVRRVVAVARLRLWLR